MTDSDASTGELTTTGPDPVSTGPLDATDGPTATGPSATTNLDTGGTTTATGPMATTSLDSSTGEPSSCEMSPYMGNGECDPYAQDCPDGFKCTPYANDGGSAWNSTRCAAVDPNPVGEGMPCMVQGGGATGDDNCELGALCFNVNAQTLVGTCSNLCTCGLGPGEVSCDDGFGCVVYNDGELPLCTAACHPLLQDCADGDACVPEPNASEFFFCAPDASGAGGNPGDPCEFINACNPGQLCAAAAVVPGCNGVGCCTPYCDLTDPNPACLPGQTCQPFFPGGAPLPELGDVGACAL